MGIVCDFCHVRGNTVISRNKLLKKSPTILFPSVSPFTHDTDCVLLKLNGRKSQK